MQFSCRSCGAELNHSVINLGHQPPSNSYLNVDNLNQSEISYPLEVFLCDQCWLMQLPEHASAVQLFTADYAYLSSTSSSWLAHAKKYVDMSTSKLSLDSTSHVVELASNDGYLLQYFQATGIPCTGIEPTSLAADISRSKGISTVESFFGLDLASSIQSADLIVANNVLAHVPDVNDFVSGMAVVLKPCGHISIEFPHLLRLIKGNQFDTIYHEHFSYISLNALQRLLARHDLHVIDVEELSTHGGSLRVWVTHRNYGSPTSAVSAMIYAELDFGLERYETYADFQENAFNVKINLLDFLIKSRQSGKTVCAYGAAAKGNTLLNYAGVRSDLINVVADLAPSKIGKYMPGNHIPIVHPDELELHKPDSLIVLPWNLISEISSNFKQYNLYTSIPQFCQWN